MSSEPGNQLWQVAVNAPLNQVLTYEGSSDLLVGQSVIVPLGKRKVDGVIVGIQPPEKSEKESKFKIKSILETHPERPLIDEKKLSWLSWIANYYCYPLGQIMQLSFPPLKKKGRGSRKKSIIQENLSATPDSWLPLTEEQQKVFGDIQASKGFSTHLLFGVTGSGKTEVYLKLLQETLNSGKTGLVLVPEISLTPQLIQRFAQRFGDQAAVIHSQLTEREKTDQWWSVVDGRKQILIGARSALFCPIPNLGMIVLDEEHEPSFKQDEKLKYHARDAAVMLAHKLDCPIVLGSATPSLESWENAQKGRYQLHTMSRRVADRAMPEISIVDLKEKKEEDAEKKKKNDLPFWLSPKLFEALKENLANEKQAALFLNRRGIAQTLTCPACGDTRECPNCAISLTLHGHNHLVCHYCDYHETKQDICSACGDGQPEPLGLGTERVEEDLQKLFPEACIARADRDEIQSREQLEELIERMESGEIDFLIGTQMIAKGLDFPKLHLVGLVLADVGFHLPDFRAGERIFQLITQVSGRAGRHVKPGEAPGQVIVQTYNPDHPILQLALQGDFSAFAEYELSFRQGLGYPPCGRMALFRIQAPEQKLAQDAASTVKLISEKLQAKFSKYQELKILGPAEAPMFKLRNQYRFQMIIKGPSPWELVQFCQHISENTDKLPKKSRVIIDVDPMNVL